MSSKGIIREAIRKFTLDILEFEIKVIGVFMVVFKIVLDLIKNFQSLRDFRSKVQGHSLHRYFELKIEKSFRHSKE